MGGGAGTRVRARDGDGGEAEARGDAEVVIGVGGDVPPSGAELQRVTGGHGVPELRVGLVDAQMLSREPIGQGVA